MLILNPIFSTCPHAQNDVAGAAVHPQIDRLQREILAFHNSCLVRQEADYSVYGSSTLDVIEDLCNPDAEISPDPNDSECRDSVVEGEYSPPIDVIWFRDPRVVVSLSQT